MLMYVQRKEGPSNDMIYVGDKRTASSTQASRAFAANATYWAAPVAGAGEPVLLRKLSATG